MASTYLPGDIFTRFMKKCGADVQYVSATDVHGTWVKKELVRRGITKQAIADEWHGLYTTQFGLLNIQFDSYGRTDDQKLEELVRDSLMNLRDAGLLFSAPSTNYECSDCGEMLPKRFRLKSQDAGGGRIRINQTDTEYVCNFCNSANVVQNESMHWFLDLAKAQGTASRYVASEPNLLIKSAMAGVLKEGLEPWDFTRENYLGSRLPWGERELYVYLWYESLLGYLSSLPGDVMNSEGLQFRHFYGKNIIYYHSTVWPIILEHGLKRTDIQIQASPRGFLNYTNSDPALVDLEQATSTYHPDYLRFYVAYRVSDSLTDYTFNTEELIRVVDGILCHRIGNTFNRIRSIMNKNGVQAQQRNFSDNFIWGDSFPKVKAAFEQQNVQEGIKEIQNYFQKIDREIDARKLYRNPTPGDLQLLGSVYLGGLMLMSPIMPTLVNQYNIFSDIDVVKSRFIDPFAGSKLAISSSRWNPLT